MQDFKLESNTLLKFGDGDGPNHCRVKKVDVSSTFIENISVWVDPRQFLRLFHAIYSFFLKIFFSELF